MSDLADPFAVTGEEERGALAEINVTPLVDVILVLLIIFMVTAPMMKQGIDVRLPDASRREFSQGSEDRYVLTIDKESRIFLDNSEIPLDHLQLKLKQLNESSPVRAIFLQADKSISYGSVVQVMDIVKLAGIDTLGMVTRSLEEIQE